MLDDLLIRNLSKMLSCLDLYLALSLIAYYCYGGCSGRGTTQCSPEFLSISSWWITFLFRRAKKVILALDWSRPRKLPFFSPSSGSNHWAYQLRAAGAISDVQQTVHDARKTRHDLDTECVSPPFFAQRKGNNSGPISVNNFSEKHSNDWLANEPRTFLSG